MLGPLEAWDQGRPLPLGGVKQRAVLAMLALRANRVAPVEQLVEGLWATEPPASAVNIVQVYVSRLRKVLADGPGCTLRRHGPGYVLELGPEALDLHRFERLAREGAEAATTGPETAADRLAEALQLWRGEPLAEFVDEPFAQAERPWLQEQRLACLTARVEADLGLGRHAQLVGEFEALVRAHPLVEELHRQLILSLYRCGRQADALSAYRRVRAGLADELGIDAGRRLRDLEAAVLAQDPRLDWTPPVRVDPPVARVQKLPSRNAHFTGRGGLIEQLHSRLASGDCSAAVQTLHGMGGVGKTQLAIEYAHRFAADYDVVWWIDAERPVLIGEQLTALAARLGLPPGRTHAETIDRLLVELRGRDRWLLVFDNAVRPSDIVDELPGGGGHVVVTSRFPGWGALGGRLEVDVLPRAETIALLRARIPALSQSQGDDLAAELGDLPLAAAQAAAYLEQTDLPPGDYLRRYRTRRATLLARGEVPGYAGRVDTAWALSVERLRDQDPAAVQLLELAAFLAPEPVPLSLLARRPDPLDEPLRTAAADEDALGDTVGSLVSYSLARRHRSGFQVHRLVQAAVRERLEPGRRQAAAEQAVALLAAALPGTPEDPARWDAYAELAPHVLAAAADAEASPAGRRLVLDIDRYLQARGDSVASRAVCEPLVERRRTALGPDHPDTLTAASSLTRVLVQLGEVAQARGVGEDTLDRARRVLGSDHPTTLWTAAALIQALGLSGDVVAARALAEDTWRRCSRVLGADAAVTLLSAAALTGALAATGDAEQARALGEDTLGRCRRVLGADHATTLWAAAALTTARVQVGEAGASRVLGEDTLHRCRRVFGPDHATTLWTAAALTLARVELRDTASARALGEDTLARCRRVLGPDHPRTLLAAGAVAHALNGEGDFEAAHDVGEEALQRCTRRLGPDHPIALLVAAALIRARAAVGDVEGARDLGGDTVRRCQQALSPEQAITVSSESALSDAHDRGNGRTPHLANSGSPVARALG
ncbi:tetratricopeptide repeat protein [Motilibacter sp. E257]|uniref:Tetratricopeptide repeat protein n=2 Tax=Motilibacter deserti TaxID=2714956 RepID=A0ABX0GTF3_9ACTN|nr:FxSxx-COOH system tetratricopeptide repeat protein [Motilibacter deserti]NHC12929.1 tetratricopeptide repeat protein [Motilibacter deserti]